MAKVRESLIVQIARDATSLAFCFVCKIETCVSEFTVGGDECGTGCDDSSSLENGPEQRQQREGEQNRESGRGPGERRALDKKRERKRC